MMKYLIFLTFVFQVAPAWANSFDSSQCSGKYECGVERITGIDNRIRPRVVQPPASAVMGSCGKMIPANQAYDIQIDGLTCGESVMKHPRFPEPVEKEVMSQWGTYSRMGGQRARRTMQEIRQYDIKWSGELEFPMYEHWNWKERVGNFDSRCGFEPWQTTCERSRVENYTETYTVDVCKKWEETDSSGSGSGSSGGSFGSGGGDIGGGYKAPGLGSGESADDLRRGWDESSLQSPNAQTARSGFLVGAAHASTCLRWGEEKRTRPAQKTVDPVSYSCLKQRPRFCEWLETRHETRRCANHKMTYAIEYSKDSDWTPEGISKGVEYMDILPNKYDLLPGESETVLFYGNTGRSRSMKPAIAIDNKWNAYSIEAEPSSIRCEYKMEPNVQMTVNTENRLLRKAPNPLALPVDRQGNPLEPLKFDEVDGLKHSPYEVELTDIARATMLYNAKFSRSLPRPEGAGEADEDAIVSTVYNGEDPNSLQMIPTEGFWQETRFKMQLVREDKWGREVRVTQTNPFDSNEAEYFREKVVIPLKGQGAVDRLYQASGPFEFLFGGLYKKFGVELTPGEEYLLKVQVIQRGLPFYESGCEDDSSAVCEGEEGSNDAYSEPLVVRFTPEADQRSWFKRFKDFQERLMWF